MKRWDHNSETYRITTCEYIVSRPLKDYVRPLHAPDPTGQARRRRHGPERYG